MEGEVLAYLDEGVEELTDILGHKELVSAVRDLATTMRFRFLKTCRMSKKRPFWPPSALWATL